MKKFVFSTFLLAAITCSLMLGSVAQAATLYGVSLWGGDGTGTSHLYSINTTTGAGTFIGDIGHNVNSIAVDPTTGFMYGSTTSWSGDYNGLVRIAKDTGVGTSLGSYGAAYDSIVGLTFNSAGELWAWHDPGADDPVMINKATGAVTVVGESGVGTGGHVMAFDNSDNLIMVQSSTMYTINQATGAAVSNGSLGYDPGQAGADFDPLTGLLWATLGRPTAADTTITISDLGGDGFTQLGTDIAELHALTFDAEGVAPPPAVPEPSTFLLLGAGLAGLAFLRRKMQ